MIFYYNNAMAIHLCNLSFYINGVLDAYGNEQVLTWESTAMIFNLTINDKHAFD